MLERKPETYLGLRGRQDFFSIFTLTWISKEIFEGASANGTIYD